jgi:pimeloyl-ACP methyl ester carboxylesterase
MEHVTVGGMRIAYQRAGSGPPLVLLHGAFGFDSRSWRPQLDDLADAFTVVAWDMPGCGESPDPPAGFTADDYADCLAAFIAELGLDHPHLLGLSFGSVLALDLYKRHPNLPRSLALASAYAGWAGSLPQAEIEQRKLRLARAYDLPPGEWAATWSPSMLSDAAPATVVSAVAAQLAAFHPAGQRALFQAFADLDLRDVLPHISIPTLLLYGDEDVRSPLGAGDMMRAAIPDAQMVVLAGVGHVSNMEVPERFNTVVRAFLNTVHM